jgi:hypothetical protein
MKCPVCKYAKCRWIDLEDDPSKVSTEKLERVLNHNNAVVEMIFRDEGSAYGEERMYARLGPYAEELERRRA